MWLIWLIPLESAFIYSFKFRHVPNPCDGSTSGKRHLRKSCICSSTCNPPLYICNPPLYISRAQLSWLLPRSSKAVADSAELQEECLAALKRATIVPWFGRCGQPGQKMELDQPCDDWWGHKYMQFFRTPCLPFSHWTSNLETCEKILTWLERR